MSYPDVPTSVRSLEQRIRQRWLTLYETAIEGVEVITDVDAAVVWANEFVQQIAAASD